MSYSDSLRSTPLKSKASLNLTSNSPISKTPDRKSSHLSNRARNRRIALSFKEIRQVAQSRHKPHTDKIKSARKKILSRPTESPPPNTSSFRLDKLPEKRFLYGHLVQLKHILPEAIEIKRMLVFDEMSSCMKTDLQISIIVDAIDYGDNSKPETKNLKLRKVFRAELADYIKAHPEVDEIPEADLPETFNQSKQAKRQNVMKGPILLSSDESLIDTLTEQQSFSVQGEVIQEEPQPQPSNCSKSESKLLLETLPGVVNDQQHVVASHVSRSFRKRFSLKTTSKSS